MMNNGFSSELCSWPCRLGSVGWCVVQASHSLLAIRKTLHRDSQFWLSGSFRVNSKLLGFPFDSMCLILRSITSFLSWDLIFEMGTHGLRFCLWGRCWAFDSTECTSFYSPSYVLCLEFDRYWAYEFLMSTAILVSDLMRSSYSVAASGVCPPRHGQEVWTASSRKGPLEG